MGVERAQAAVRLLELVSEVLMSSTPAGLDSSYIRTWLERQRDELIWTITVATASIPVVDGQFRPPEGHSSDIDRAVRDLITKVDDDTLFIVSCGASKLDHAAPAGELYKSGYFQDNLAAARALAGGDDRVRILSAKHGLVHPREWLEPYELRLGMEGAVSPERVRNSLMEWRESLSLSGKRTQIVVFGGVEYRGFVQGAAPGLFRVLSAYGELGGGLPVMRGVARGVKSMLPQAG